jgi:putative membrane protein
MSGIDSLVASGDWGDHGAWGALWLVFWIAALATTAWVVLRLVRRRGPSGLDRAREILAERYARGELSSEEYRERLEQLR